ncbi:site-specific integrase [Phocaeicola sp.]|jgi:Site-specific recombinase XerD|uniref:site-specific integrase n=1 Tax=Phocaeicola sp. TaxID=2773926 RepID=UPI00283BC518|nr:site-specific integrase [Phocaeicola sp.]MDR4058476.1 site-specific integrase [Phocaeicola sp.]
MATIKVKLRPSSVVERAGTIYYQVTHRRATQQITTNIRLQPDEWDTIGEQVVVSVADKSIIQNRIDSDIALLKRIVKDLNNSGVTYSVGDIVKRFKSPECHVLVLDFMQNQIRLMRNANRLGTALNYEKTMKNFVKFLGGVNLPFSAMTEQVIADYNAFLVQRGMVRNSISFYMRIMRAVYNKAVRQKLVEQSHPFTEVYTGIDRTRKRAVSESVISQLYKLNLAEGTPLALARDIFIFSYCTRGMAFVDIAYLKRENIQNGVICYARRKTGQLLSVRIEPSIQRIIDRYSSALSPYVFPILTSTETKPAYEEYQVAINNHNRQLRRLSKMLPAGCKLTSYTSRHSWATAARNHNVPISVISAGMGHTSEQTTQIYLTMLENSVIDDANQGLIRSLLE